MKRYFPKKKVFLFLFLSLTYNLFSQTFVEQTDISLPGASNGSTTWGDYDNDGDLDILLIGNSGNYSSYYHVATIYRNDGNNTFTELPGTSFYKADNGAVVWGDYNNDSFLDILLVGHYGISGPISIIYKNNGNSTFSEQTDIILRGVQGNSSSWGDYNKDGYLDLLINGYASSMEKVTKVYKNNKAGTFSEQAEIQLPSISSGSSAWCDYDNDGFLDFILTGQDNDGTSVSKLYKNNGAGNFSEQTDISLTGVYYGSLAWGDYNNDGYEDILLTGTSGFPGGSYNPVSKIYKNNCDGTFSELSNITLTGVFASSVSWGDYDNDGYSDILLTGSAGGSYPYYDPVSIVYKNNGDETFVEQTGISLPGVIYSSASWVDYNNDGKLDIFLTGQDNTGQIITKIFKNTISSVNNAPAAPTGTNSNFTDNELHFTWDTVKFDETPSKGLTYNIRLGKTSGGSEILNPMSITTSGFRKIVANGNVGHQNTFLLKNIYAGKYYWNVQTVDNGMRGGSFSTDQIVYVDSIQTNGLSASIIDSTSLLLKWKRGNGNRCIVFCRNGVANAALPEMNKTYIPDNTFGLGDQIGTTGWYCIYNGISDSLVLRGLIMSNTYTISVIEYVGNTGNECYFRETRDDNIGIFSTNFYTEQTDIPLDGIHQGCAAWGDYDNDGFLDIIITGTTGGNPISKVYHNEGNNNFSEQTDIVLPGVFESAVAWGDYNNDEYLDIFLSGLTTNGSISKVFMNNGEGTFSDQTDISFVKVFSSAIALGDFNNDELLDVFIAGIDSTETRISKLYRNNGNNTFSELNGLSIPGFWEGSAEWADFNNDGYIDLVMAGDTGYYPNDRNIAKVFKNNGDETFSEQDQIYFNVYYPSSVTWGDYNNDFYPDLLLNSRLYRNNKDGTFTRIDIGLRESSTPSSWGDFDNDGDLDILSCRESENSKIIRNNGNDSFTELTNISLPDANFCSWGDYNNDGNLDFILAGGYSSLIFRNNSNVKTGEFERNYMPSSPTGLTSSVTPGVVTLNWEAAVDDFTKTNSLSYNLRFKEKETDIWYKSAQSDDDSGFRRTVSLGNIFLNSSFVLQNMPVAEYYWQVQAIDQGYMGGAWSAIDSFEVKNVQAFYDADEVCLGFATTFTDQSVATDGIASWNWDFKDGETSTEQNPVHIYSASGTYNVKLVITDNSGIRDSLTQSVIVKPKPLTGFAAPSVCQGTATAFTNNTDNNGLVVSSWYWDFGDGQSSIDQNPAPHGYLGAADYIVMLKAQADNGCRDSISKTVTVASYPVAAVTANAPLTFCKGDSVVLSVPYVSGYLYTWKIDETNLTDGDSSKYVSRLTGNYSVEIVNPKGNCTTNSSAVGITAQDAPTAPLISADGDLVFCQSDSVILSVTNIAGYTYQWKLNGGAVGADSSQYSAKSFGTYSLTVSNSTGCAVDATNEVTVTVYSAPTLPTVNLSGSTTFCEGDSVELSVTNNPDYTYKWENNGSVIPRATSYSYKALSSGTYKLNISNSYGCITMTSPVDVTVKPMPYEPVITSDNYKAGECMGETPIMLYVEQEVPGYSYQWYRNGIPVAGETLSYIEDFLTEGDYSLEADFDGCTAESDVVSVYFEDAPDKPFIHAQGPTVWYLVCSDTTGSNYRWYCNGNLIEGADDYYYIAGRKMGDYQLSIGNSLGCFTRSDIVTIPTGDTGMDDIDPFEGLKIYPNPSNGHFIAEIENEIFGDLLIKIISQDGKELFNFMFEKTSAHFIAELNISEQPEGYYLIIFDLNKHFTVRRIIID